MGDGLGGSCGSGGGIEGGSGLDRGEGGLGSGGGSEGERGGCADEVGIGDGSEGGENGHGAIVFFLFGIGFIFREVGRAGCGGIGVGDLGALFEIGLFYTGEQRGGDGDKLIF